MSGYMDVEVMSLGLEFLRKPFTPDALLKRVRDVLDGKVDSTGPTSTADAAAADA